MTRLPGKCPVCSQELEAVRLQCPACGTSVEGHFELCKYCRLEPDHLAFLELFLKSRGNVKDVERELGLSYPTVRNRLDAMLAALGYAPEPEESGDVTRRKREILDALDAGKINSADAIKQLRERKE